MKDQLEFVHVGTILTATSTEQTWRTPARMVLELIEIEVSSSSTNYATITTYYARFQVIRGTSGALLGYNNGDVQDDRLIFGASRALGQATASEQFLFNHSIRSQPRLLLQKNIPVILRVDSNNTGVLNLYVDFFLRYRRV